MMVTELTIDVCTKSNLSVIGGGGGVGRHLRRLSRCCEPAQMRRAVAVFQDRVEGFVLEVPGKHHSSDLREFSRTVLRVLTCFSHALNHKPLFLQEGRKNPSRSWMFEFAGEIVTMTTIAPFYPETNSRFQFSDARNNECCYILFQPESSFHLFDTGPGRPITHMDWQHPISVREKIRCLYRKHGREYDIADDNEGAFPQVETLVRPLYKGQPPIKWWTPDPFA